MSIFPFLQCGKRAAMLLMTSMFLLAALVWPGGALAKTAIYKTGAPPAWVDLITPALAARKPDVAAFGVERLLSDVQVRVDNQGSTTYSHYASKAVDGNGITSIASISTSFDPTYQSLTLHRIDIVRNGRRIDKLATADIRVLQREQELEAQLYDGNQTVNIAVDDVRIGDVVEYAYTHAGDNPVFKNLAASGAYLQWGVPVDRVVLRLLVPAGRDLVVKPFHQTAAPLVTQAQGYREYRWDQHGVAALKVENKAPGDYNPYARVRWSEFADWAAVTRWALPLYRPPADPGKDLRQAIEQIRAAHATPGARLLAVLRLVQRDIRYLGIEVGAGSHAPTHPALVYKRRFGDCKDKAMLVLAMLGALGIDAHAALVDTDASLTADAMASPNAFNHVIVRATVNGKLYWLDPTMSEQQGDLDHVFQPDYGLSLVLAGGTRGLEKMEAPRHKGTVARNVIDSSAGFDAPVRYTVETTYRGADAERMRAQLAGTGAKDKSKEYLDYYARTYPTISQAAPLEVLDNAPANTLTTREAYSITAFWPVSKNGKRRVAYFEPDLNGKLTVPDALTRVAPLAIRYPEQLDETFEVRLPEAWDAKAQTVRVDDPAFNYRMQVEPRNDGRSLFYHFHYKALADRVAPAALARYAERIREARGTLGRSLYTDLSPDAGEDSMLARFDWRGLLVTVLFCTWVMLGLIWLTAPAEHKVADALLLSCFIGISAVFATVTILFEKPAAIRLVGLASLFVGAHSVLAVGRRAPWSHWTYGVVNPATPGGVFVFKALQSAVKSAWVFALLIVLALFVALMLGYRPG